MRELASASRFYVMVAEHERSRLANAGADILLQERAASPALSYALNTRAVELGFT
jgi:hypothetical protein